jgi:DNA-binding NarL/FixJ family response regulator
MDDGCRVTATRILLVEDHEPFRKFIRTLLTKQEELQVVDETGNGLDAVTKCAELQPALVLMDIGLPGLNGIEAARRIRASLPACKVVFLTKEDSPEILQEAFNLGASAYVFKSHASNDLLPAIAAALEGRQFVSQRPAPGQDVRDMVQAVASEDGGVATAHLKARASHPVHFHPDEPSLVAGFARFIKSVLAGGNAVIAITTELHRVAILQMLQGQGVDVAAAIDAGRFAPLDVDETLAKFMVDDLPDPARFFSAASEVVKSVKAINQGVRVLACGEIAPTLWARGKREAAVQLEQLWDRLVRVHDLETLCGYMLSSSERDQESGYDRICAEHSSIHYFCH